jgi:hypothetical protein
LATRTRIGLTMAHTSQCVYCPGMIGKMKAQ